MLRSTGFSWQAVVSTAYTAGLASLVGYGIFNGLLSRNQSSSVVPWVLLAPVVAMASAWWLLGQQPSLGESVGGALLIVGVLVALRRPRSRPVSVPGDGGAGLGEEAEHVHPVRRPAALGVPLETTGAPLHQP